MSYTVDLSQSYAFVEGVEDVFYVGAGISSTPLKARRGDTLRASYGGSDYEASPVELEWSVWPYGLSTGQEILVSGTITDASGVIWSIVEVLGKRADGSQVHVRTVKAIG